jgi:predicted O-linked N-acetylglucosamine transferase (SPINDLY family)
MQRGDGGERFAARRRRWQSANVKRARPDPKAFERALRAYESGNRSSAEVLLKQLTLREPEHAAGHYVLGLLALESGRNELALDRFSNACRFEPGNAGFLTNRAEAARRLGRLEEAIAGFETALLLDATRVEACFNLGLALDARGELVRARDAFAAAVALRPAQPTLLHRLAQAQLDLGELDLAVETLQAVLAVAPGDQRAFSRLGSVLLYLGRHDEALASLERALELSPNDAASHSALIFQLSFQPRGDARRILDAAREFARRHEQPLVKTRPASYHNAREPERRLRVGYVSADYRLHVTANVVLPLLRHHDPKAFEIYCYSSGRRSDATTEIFRCVSHHFRDISDLDDATAAKLVARDQIDVLVDLTMHMAENRLLLFARKPAPVQLSWFAYPGTTGLSAIDYRVTDVHLDPPGQGDESYSEESLRLPDSFWCWEPLLEPLDCGPPPCLARGLVTFGCLNNFCKVNDDTLDLWARVLLAVPGSQLLLQAPDGSARKRVIERLSRRDVASARVRFVSHQPRSEYFALYREIDIGLDTLPYNGHTTSLDAFWMGVPMLTLIGTTLVGRAGLCQAVNLGLTELVASSSEQFVARAAELAQNPDRLAELRGSLRSRLVESPLMNGARFARAMEDAYRAAWRAWCQKAA